MNYKYTRVLNFWLLAYSAFSIGMQLEQKTVQTVYTCNAGDLFIWCPEPLRRSIVKQVILTGSVTDFFNLRSAAKIFNEDTTAVINSLQENELQGWCNNYTGGSWSSLWCAFSNYRFIKVGICCKAPLMLKSFLKMRSQFNDMTLIESSRYIDKLCTFYKRYPTKEDCYAKCRAISLVTDGLLSIADSRGLATMFHNTVCSGYFDLTKLLIQKKVDVNIRNGTDMTPLHKIISGTDWHEIIWRIDWLDENNKCARKKAMITYLLENRADINAQDRWKMTPLHVACQMRGIPLSIVQYLVERGSDLKLKDSENHTSLEVARRHNVDSKIISYLEQVIANSTK